MKSLFLYEKLLVNRELWIQLKEKAKTSFAVMDILERVENEREGR